MRSLMLLPLLALAACSEAPNNTAELANNAAAPAQETSPPVASPSPEATAQQLTPGGWGPLRIGMSRAEVAALGEDANPGAVGGADPEACDQFRPQNAPEGLMVMLENGSLSRITLTEGDVTTDRGIGVGASAAEVRAAYGDQIVASPHKYVEAPAGYLTHWASGVADAGAESYVENAAARGIRYEIGSNGVVSAIHAGGPSIQLVEGCS